MWNPRRVASFYTAELPSRQEIRRNRGCAGPCVHAYKHVNIGFPVLLTLFRENSV
jgi:hypothetical protein